MEQNGGGSSSRFIVDIMPNLKFLINNDILLADCDNDMKAFEQQVVKVGVVVTVLAEVAGV